ncbi:hypothetical protein AK830_g4093 [Neonectria ditissima]|uniref:Clr5 domain-containing protein n=1 Tax=Neonectria ditissima TaxID=78410 RepID=A0A0P7BP24_9HYPO|nr:hypothetical protein AK830_g4093 [Neonectria ditissima]
MPFDWTPYEREVINVHVNGPKTAKDTLAYLRQKYGINATISQFKRKFGGKRNLRADEWKVVISKVRERKAEGKASAVYLHGRQLEPERVTRETQRYLNKTEVKSLEDIDLGINTTGQHRLEIRDVVIPCSQLITHTRSCIPRGLPKFIGTRNFQEIENLAGTAGHGIDFDFATQADLMGLDLSTPGPQDFPEFPTFFGSQSPSNLGMLSLQPNQRSPTPSQLDMTQNQMVRIGSYSPRQIRVVPPSEASALQAPPAKPTAIAGWAEPLFPLFWESQEIVSLIPAIGRPSMLSAQSHLGAPNRSDLRLRIQPKNPGWIHSHLMSVNSNLRILEPSTRFIEQLMTIAESGFSRSAVTELPDPDDQSQQSLICIFSVMVYLISNNLLQDHQIRIIIRWAVDKRLNEKLANFLQANSKYTRSSAIILLQQQGIENGEKTPASFRNIDPVLPFSLSKRRRAPKGLSWILFREAIDRNDVENAKSLVSRGADVNCFDHHCSPGTCFNTSPGRESIGHKRTPLLYAIEFGSGAMISYLVGICADNSGTALLYAMKLSRFETVHNLLRKTTSICVDTGAQAYRILEDFKSNSPREYKVVREKLSSSEEFQVFELIEAANRGNLALAELVLEYDIKQRELERCLCEAVKLMKPMAVATLLERGVDPNARRYRLANKAQGKFDEIEESHPIELALDQKASWKCGIEVPGIVCLLIRAGADISDELLVRSGEAAAASGLGFSDFIISLIHKGHDAALCGPPMLARVVAAHSIFRCGILLDAGVPVNAYSKEYCHEDYRKFNILGQMSAIQVAAFHGHLALVQYLAGRGGDVNLPAHDDCGRTALQIAAETGHFEVVKWLISAGADFKAPPAIEGGVTVLEAVTGPRKYHDIDRMFKYLLALGAPINHPDGGTSTVLHRLARIPHNTCVELALEAGAGVGDREDGWTPLQVAAKWGHTEVILTLLSHGSDINACAADGFKGHTALQEAASSYDSKTVKLLLQHGADVNAPAGAVHGRTALQAAAEVGDIEMVKLLLRNDADVNAPAAADSGRTALQAAMSSLIYDPRIATLLINSGADINAAGSLKNGRTAVEGAAEHGRLDMVRLLLNAGAMPGNDGFSRAIELADENDHFAIGDLLEGFVESGKFIFTGSSNWLSENVWPSLAEEGMVIDDEEVDRAIQD